MPKKYRVHELAKELGMTNAELIELCDKMGVGVKSHSSSIIEAQADRLRRRAERDGLTRDEQPEEKKPAKKSAAKKSAAKKTADTTEAEPKAAEAEPAADEPSPPAAATADASQREPADAAPAAAEAPPERAAAARAQAEPVSSAGPDEGGSAPAEREAPPEAPATVGDTAPAAPTPAAEPEAPEPAAARTEPEAPAAAQAEAPVHARPEEALAPAAAQAQPEDAPTPAEPQAPAPAAAETAPTDDPARAEERSETKVISSGRPAPHAPPPQAPEKAGDTTEGGEQRTPEPVAAQATSGAPAPAKAKQQQAPAPERPTPPRSPSGKPIPPPPGRPLSPSGKPIPPPPGTAQPPGSTRPGGGSRSGGPTRSGGPGPRTSGGPRPGGGPGTAPRPGGGGGPRPGGGPGGPGGPRPGGGPPGRPSGQRRPPRRGRRGRRRRDREELQPQATAYTPSDAPVPDETVVIERGVSAQEFGPKLNRTAADVVRFLLNHGEMITATATLADEQMELFALEVGADILLVEPGQQEEMQLQALFDDSDDEDEAAQQSRPPVITIMGHVDHGKTTLLDQIRSANVVRGEAGGITQHIGAYQVDRNGQKVTFIDTPGHAAFTQMRSRGAQATDIVVLMVAADDGVMPQTAEAIDHARAADVPIVVAMNKIDKDNADPQRVLAQLSEQGLVPESWGGDTIVVEMSAVEGLGVDELLDQLLVVAELEELTANPTGRAKGIVLEANLDVGRGTVATILVDKGELKRGDPIVAGATWGRVRAMIDDQGKQVKSVGPGTPVQVLGLQSVPQAGDEFRVAPDEKVARMVGDSREQRQRLRSQRGDARVKTGTRLEDVFSQIQAGEKAQLNLVLKADVHGSLEAVTESLRKLERDEVELGFVHRGVGGITENDITLAGTTNATIIGFNVRPDRKARAAADAAGVEIRTYEIIYKLLEDIEQAVVGMLEPEYEEVVTGEAEVREIFRVPRIGAIAGCYVQTGTITRGSKVRFLRDGTIIWKGSVTSLKRYKEDATEVRAGFECGIGLSDFQDLKQGDLIETFEEREIART